MTAVAVVPTIETSSIMESSGFAGAATIGAAAFINDLVPNDALAVASFGALGLIDYPSNNALAVVDSTLSQLAAASAAVQALTFNDPLVNLGSGLQSAYGLLSGAPAGSQPGALLISSGQQSGGGTDPLTLARYVPTWVCAPGPTANLALLNQIAVISRGFYYYMPTAADMQTILNQIRGGLPGWSTVVNVAKPVSPLGFWLQPVSLPGGLAEAQFSIVWDNASLTQTNSPNPGPNQVSITLVAPPGITRPTTPTLSGGGYCVFDLTTGITPGQWYVQVMYPGTTAPLPMTIGVFSRTSTTSAAPALTLGATGAPTAGAPVEIEARLDGGAGVVEIQAASAEIAAPRASIRQMARIYADRLAEVGGGDLPQRLLTLRRVLLSGGDILAPARRALPLAFDKAGRAQVALTPAAIAGGLNGKVHVRGVVDGQPFERTELISLHVPD